MTGYTNTLFPICWYIERFFLFFTMKKERNAPKERKTRVAAFFCRKMPVTAPHPSPPQVGEGAKFLPSQGKVRMGACPQRLMDIAILRLSPQNDEYLPPPAPALSEQGITVHDKLFCHAELGSASYQYGIILVFW